MLRLMVVLLCVVAMIGFVTGCQQNQIATSAETSVFSGRVVNSDGDHVQGVVIAVLDSATPPNQLRDGEQRIHSAETDGAGEFRITGIKEGYYIWLAFTDGDSEELLRIAEPTCRNLTVEGKGEEIYLTIITE